MNSGNGQTWMLLDPPSSKGYARRASLREKCDAPRAPFPSIDLVLLSGRIRDAGFLPIFLDAQINRLRWDDVVAKVKVQNAAGVLALISSERLDDELENLRRIGEGLGIPTMVVGTVHLVLHPQRCSEILQKHVWLRGIVLNSAENNLGELLTDRDGDVAPDNIAIRRGGDVLIPTMRVSYVENLRIPQPEHSIFRDPRYFFPQSKHTPVSCVQMSFGCPFTCEFCLDNALYRNMCYRDVNDVIDELAEVDGLGFKEVYFKDLTFGLNRRVTTEFLEKLIQRRLKLRWLCTTRVDVATPRLLDLMRAAGCYGIEFGVESGLRHRRKANGKPIDDEAIREVFANCRKLGLETTAFVMIGFEDETEVEIRQTMRFVESLSPDYASYNVVNALPGAPLYDRAVREGFLRDEEGDHRFRAGNLKLKHLTPERLEALRDEAVRSFYTRPSTAFRRLIRARSWFELRKLVGLGRLVVGV